jgi:uncharacterized protein (TIGR02391 family)
MKPKEAVTDLWTKGYFESVRTTKEIDKQLADEYGASSENLTAVLNNCGEFLRKMGKAGWRQRTRYDAASIGNNGKNIDYFALLDIHPKVKKASQELFLNGHYPSAIFEAFKQVEILVKEKSGIKGKFGAALMQEVFSANAPVLKINDGAKDSDGDEQKGFVMLFTGAQIGIRDPKGHDNIEQKDPKIAMQYIAFASLLCRMVDKSTKVGTT